jgi:hypothetical protein
MPEWLKNISGLLGKKESGTVTLRDRLDAEQRRLRESTELSSSGRTLEEERHIQQEDVEALKKLLAWKLDVKADHLLANPAKVDGIWFQVRRYFRAGENGSGSVPSWTLHSCRVCPGCKTRIPTIILGDYAEIADAVERIATGKGGEVTKSTPRLAAYLADVEANRPDPYCPRFCPECHKPIRGGTL